MPLIKYKKEKEDKKRRLSLSLIVSDRCNISCVYCYEKKSERKKGDMKISTAKEAITHYIEREDGFKNASIEFFGGEPLLAFPLIKEIVQWSLTRKWKKKIFFSLVTNGTILTSEIKEWLAKYSKYITVAFTIDGCKMAHDLNRNNSYDLVYANIPFFKQYWPYQPTKFTLNDKTIPFIAESVIQLENMELNFNGGIVLEDIWGNAEKKAKLLEIYEEQLVILLDFYEKRPHLFPPPPLFPILPESIDMINPETEQSGKELVRFCGAGFEMVTIDVDGTVYPCHRFLPLCTGKPAPVVPVNRQTRWKPDKCSECKLLFSCPTCAGFNYQVNSDTGIRSTFHCEAYKLGLMAQCNLEASRFHQLEESGWEKITEKEKDKYRSRLAVILDIIDSGVLLI